MGMKLTARRGPRPRTTLDIPHLQLDQQPADPEVREELARRAFALPGVVEEPSGISLPGARALVLATDFAMGPREAFIVGREFAHLHPGPDQSLHVALPVDVARDAFGAGWGERHPAAGSGSFGEGLAMLYAPRDGYELEQVFVLLSVSHAFAAGRVVSPVLPA
jgi:hypothetical protein